MLTIRVVVDKAGYIRDNLKSIISGRVDYDGEFEYLLAFRKYFAEDMIHFNMMRLGRVYADQLNENKLMTNSF